MNETGAKLTSLQLIEMQIGQPFVAFRTDALVCSLKKICLNLLKGSQNSFLGLQPESGYRRSTGFQLRDRRRKEIISALLPRALFALPTGQSGLMAGAGAGIWALPPQFPWCGQETDWVSSLEGMRIFQYCVLLTSGWLLEPSTPYLFIFSVIWWPLRQGQLKGLVLPVNVSSPPSSNLHFQ